MTEKTNSSSSTGIDIGVVIAVVLSWDRNHSILWATWHGILGWVYVIFRALETGANQ